MQTNEIEAVESLRSLALAHTEIKFADLCTAAIDGEAWAVERVDAVMANAIIDATSAINTAHALLLIRFTDATRPDGAIARSFEV